ncbi:hypothetical protein WJX59_31390, partial [Sinorhizobium meliloti]
MESEAAEVRDFGPEKSLDQAISVAGVHFLHRSMSDMTAESSFGRTTLIFMGCRQSAAGILRREQELNALRHATADAHAGGTVLESIGRTLTTAT